MVVRMLVDEMSKKFRGWLHMFARRCVAGTGMQGPRPPEVTPH
jgi:hypothetical protein